MKSIITKILPPTNTRDRRLVATDGDTRIIIPYHGDMEADANHMNAARHFRARLKWSGRMHGGHTKQGMVFVFDGACEI